MKKFNIDMREHEHICKDVPRSVHGGSLRVAVWFLFFFFLLLWVFWQWIYSSYAIRKTKLQRKDYKVEAGDRRIRCGAGTKTQTKADDVIFEAL